MALAVAAALAACGPQSTPPAPSGPDGVTPTAVPAPTAAPAELLEQATRNMLDAPSKRVVGKVAVAIATQEFEVLYVGKDAKGRRTERAMGLESVVTFVRVGDSLYILAGEHYWQAFVRLEMLVRVSDTWVRVAADNPNHAHLATLEESAKLTQPASALAPVGADTIAGAPVVVLKDSAGNRFSIAAEGIPYLLRVEVTQETEVGPATAELTFSEFGTVTEAITAPTGKVVDLR